MAVTAWTKHLKTDEEKANYLQSLHRVKWVLDHVIELIAGCAASVEISETSPSAYNNPNWPYRQAHANGYKQALKDFTKLLTLDQGEEDGRQPSTRDDAPTRRKAGAKR